MRGSREKLLAENAKLRERIEELEHRLEAVREGKNVWRYLAAVRGAELDKIEKEAQR